MLKKVTPDYEIGCKRVLISEDYYPALNRDNVELITGGVEAIESNGLRSKDGTTRTVDTIIYGTGFHTTTFPKLFDIIGRGGRNLVKEWNQSGPEGYYGTSVHGFPNLLFMVGPNTGLGHNSIIHMMESQLNYILNYLQHLRKTPTPPSYFDVRSNAQETFNHTVQEKLSKMVWSTGGCASYYLLNYEGKNSSIWPGSTMSYRRQTKKVNIDDFEMQSPQL